MFKAVLFDLDNTLIDRDGAFRACLRRFSPQLQSELVILDAEGHGDRAVLFSAWQRLTGETMNQIHLPLLIAAQLRRDSSLLGALAELGKTVKLGIITNGGSAGQRAKLKAAGLDTIVSPDRVFVSGELSLQKPDERIFQLACQALREEPENCLFVGDQPEIDGVGSRAAGMKFLLADHVVDATFLQEIGVLTNGAGEA